jgi:phosphoesterase RecJ-like protein
MYPETTKIKQLIDEAQSIVIIQADNPDGDSLGSSLALEQILAALNKKTTMVCGVNLPSYLQYFPGWDRVEQNLPAHFDLSVIVDTSAIVLLESLTKHIGLSAIKSKPSIIIDHHSSANTIDFATVRLNNPHAAATAEVIYELANQLNLQCNLQCKNDLAAAILSDTMGLTADYTSARTVHIIAELVEAGVSLSALENARRDTLRKNPELVYYKGRLLQRIEYYLDNRLALLYIPWEEIEKYSPLYNPAMLALDDMRLTTDTKIAVVLKHYPDGRITGKIRCNYGSPLAARLAEKFGGGGHDYASGFKISGKELAEVKQDVLTYSRELMDETV